MQVDQIPSNLQTLIKNSIFSLDHDTGINCDGSFRLFQENTSVTCSIYGPRESVVQKRSYEKGNVEVQIKQFQDLAIKELRYYEQRIRLFLEDIIILDKYPRNLLTFVLIIHNDDGSVKLLSALMNSCMLALLFNGIALKQTIWTVDLTILEEKNSRSLHLYPSKAKGKVGVNSVHIGLDLVQSNVATFDTEGLLDEDLFESVYQISSELVPVLRQSIKRYIAEIVFE